MSKGQISDPPERVYTIPEQEALHVLKKYMDYEATLTDVAVAKQENLYFDYKGVIT